MLARNAESLYWIGRYVERADDTARILDVSCTSCSRTPPRRGHRGPHPAAGARGGGANDEPLTPGR